MPITYVPKPKSSVEAALSTQASPVPTPTPQDPQEESSYLDKARILAAMGLRIAGPFAGTAAGTILGAETGPGALLTGAAGRGIGSALGEGAAELVEPGGIDRIKQDPAGALKRMGLEGAIGATPLGWWGSKGKMLQSAAKAGAMGVAGTEARRYIAGEPLSPRQWSTGELVGTAASPLMGALLSRFGGHDPAPPPGPFEHTPVDLESTLEHVKNNEPLKGYQEHVLRKQYEKDPGSVKAVLKVRDERLADNTKLNDAVVGRNPAQEKAAVTAAKAETTARKMIDQEAAADIKVKLDAEAEKIKARNQTVREINEGFKANADLDKNEANVKKASDKQWTKEAANLTTAEKKDKEIADVISKHKAAEAEKAANQERINKALAQGLEPGDPVVDVRAKVNTKEGSTNVSQRWRRVVDPEADLEDVPPASPIGNPRNPKGKGPSGGAAPIAAQPAKPAKPVRPSNPAKTTAEFDAKTVGLGDNVGRPGETKPATTQDLSGLADNPKAIKVPEKPTTAKPQTTLPVIEPKDAVGPVDPSSLSPKGLIQMGYAKDMNSARKLYKDLQAAAEFKAEAPPKPTTPPEAPPAAAPAKPKPTKPQGPAGGATAKPKPDPLGGKKPMTEADNAAMAKQLIAATEKKPGVLENELPTDDMIIKKKGGLRVKGPSVNNGKAVTEPKPGAPLDVQGPSQAEGVGKVSLAKEKVPEPKVAAAAGAPEPPVEGPEVAAMRTKLEASLTKLTAGMSPDDPRIPGLRADMEKILKGYGEIMGNRPAPTANLSMEEKVAEAKKWASKGEPPKPPTAEPDPEWREVNKGEAFPPGREFKMDISTGKNYVKKLPEEMLAHPKPVEPAGPMGPEEPAKGKVVIIRDAQGLYGLERDGEVLPKHSYPTRAEAQAALNKLGKQVARIVPDPEEPPPAPAPKGKGPKKPSGGEGGGGTPAEAPKPEAPAPTTPAKKPSRVVVKENQGYGTFYLERDGQVQEPGQTYKSKAAATQRAKLYNDNIAPRAAKPVSTEPQGLPHPDITPEERAEVARILEEMKTNGYTPRMHEETLGQGGTHEITYAGKGGAKVYNDVIDFGGNGTRANVSANAERILNGGKPTDTTRAIIKVAKGRLAGDPRLSEPELPPEAGRIALGEKPEAVAPEVSPAKSEAAVESKPVEPTMKVNEFAQALDKEGDKPIVPLPEQTKPKAPKVEFGGKINKNSDKLFAETPLEQLALDEPLPDTPQPEKRVLFDTTEEVPQTQAHEEVKATNAPAEPTEASAPEPEPAPKVAEPSGEKKGAIVWKGGEGRIAFDEALNDYKAKQAGYKERTVPKTEYQEAGNKLAGYGKEYNEDLASLKSMPEGMRQKAIKGMVAQETAEQGGNVATDPDTLKRLFESQSGQANIMPILRLGGAVAGGAIGGATDPLDDPLMSTVAGAAAGAAAPGIMRNIINSSRANPNIPASTQTSIAKTAREVASKAINALPDYYRFSLLADVPNLPINMWVGPWGSAFMGSLEKMAAGDKRGFESMKMLLSPRFFKGFMSSMNEAEGSIGRAEGHALPADANAFQKIMAGPGKYMTAGDIAARDILMSAGFSEAEAREITLTSEPYTGTSERIMNMRRGEKPAPAAELMLPFARTNLNQLEQGLERVPGWGFVQDAIKGMPVSLREQVVKQFGGGVAGVGAFALGTVTPKEDARLVRKVINDFGGQYGVIASTAFMAGQAYRDGKSVFRGAAGSLLQRDLPLPSTAFATDIIGMLSDPNKSFIDKLMSSGFMPGVLRTKGDDQSPLLQLLGDTAGAVGGDTPTPASRGFYVPRGK